MSLNENFNESVRSLWASKQRTALALIGIVIGIGSVIAMVTIGRIVEQEALRNFKELGTDICNVSLNRQGGGSDSGKMSFQLQDVLTLPQHCPEIVQVGPYASIYGTITKDGKRLECPALGVDQNFARIFKIPIIEGRFISNLDQSSPFCVLSEGVQKKLQEMGAPTKIGDEIVFDGKIYMVVGITKSVPMGGFRPYAINEGIMLPIMTVLRSPKRPGITVFSARMATEHTRVQAVDQIQRYFRSVERPLPVKIVTAEQIVEQMQKQMRMFTLLLAAIGSISLIVGGVGVMNVMLVSVSERRREIGIRRALGARQRDIQTQFLVESVLLSFVGGLLGMILGVGASYVVCQFTDWQFLVSQNAIILGVGVSAAVGMFFGYYPARQASRLSPIDALRAD
ncbi:MAG: ABC transporter permease [Desulfovibrio sp.]|uniref:ABC transporter permease n=1 Tax=Desulfovibrio sp. 7SRBS1 TaxID=3378064 RepID=UPI003B41D51F